MPLAYTPRMQLHLGRWKVRRKDVPPVKRRQEVDIGGMLLKEWIIFVADENVPRIVNQASILIHSSSSSSSVVVLDKVLRVGRRNDGQVRCVGGCAKVYRTARRGIEFAQYPFESERQHLFGTDVKVWNGVDGPPRILVSFVAGTDFAYEGVESLVMQMDVGRLEVDDGPVAIIVLVLVLKLDYDLDD